MQNTGTASISSEEQPSIIIEIICNNIFIRADCIRIHAIKSNKYAAFTLPRDLLTNFIHSIRFFVHTIALALNNGLKNDAPWLLHMEQDNEVTFYFNHHNLATGLLLKEGASFDITQNCLCRQTRDILTRLHSRPSVRLIYHTHVNIIYHVKDKLKFASIYLPALAPETQYKFTEMIASLIRARLVARQLKANKTIILLRALHPLLKLLKR